MTPKQKLIVAALAIVNMAVVLTLVALVTRPATAPSLQPFYTPIPPTLAQSDCQWQGQWRATQLLAQAGLGGTVTLLADGSLNFEITYPVTAEQPITENIDDAAQAVWVVFDTALALQEREDGAHQNGGAHQNECASFTQIKVTVLAHGDQTDTQINASVSTADLMAFNAGELNEDEFIERVTYTVHALHQP